MQTETCLNPNFCHCY